MSTAHIRDALVQARAALNTALGDTPETLNCPSRASVINRKIGLINDALATLDGGEPAPDRRARLQRSLGTVAAPPLVRHF